MAARQRQPSAASSVRSLRDCSVLATSSKRPSKLDPLASCRRLHSPCRRRKSERRPATTPEHDALAARETMEPRKAAKSLARSRGSSECSLRSDSRRELTQETSTRMGGQLTSSRPAKRSNSASVLELTKSARASSSPAGDVRRSDSRWNPCTAASRPGTYWLVARSQALCSLWLSGSASAPPSATAVAWGGGAKHRSRVALSAATLPLR
mmetsp:Transcript_112406/g.362976  ORF Transcript_112406/g.362976 Transcript_112406/m.362976 type:complete len:210 (+) Transcript_112406:1052-1681(+)